jgi:putative ABC transport system permease protein
LASDAAPSTNEWSRREAVVLNESAVSLLELGSPAQAIGDVLAWRRLFRSPSTFTPLHDVEVIGVVEDFQSGPLTDSGIRPTAFYVDAGQATVLSVKLSGRDLAATRAALGEVWQRFGDPRPIEAFGFFDQTIEYMYLDLTRQHRIFAVFASVAVFLAFLGPLGLLVHTGEQRTKEVAVRRILGGQRLDIVAMLLWQFARPILLAVAIAWPFAYLAAGVWLQEFARRVELDALSFLLPALATLLAALLIVVAHACVMLRRRPVSALRYE